MTLKNIGVIGAGTMGNGIAQTCALCGFDVVMQDIGEAPLDNGMKTIQKSLERLVGKEKISTLLLLNISSDVTSVHGFSPSIKHISSFSNSLVDLILNVTDGNSFNIIDTK